MKFSNKFLCYQRFQNLHSCSGTGLGAVAFSCQILPGFYFTEKRATAVSVAAAGVSCGIFAYPTLIQFLIQQYNWRGASYILAGIFLQGAVLGAIIWPSRNYELGTAMQEKKMKSYPPENAYQLENTTAVNSGDTSSKSIRSRTILTQKTPATSQQFMIMKMRSCCDSLLNKELMKDSLFIGYVMAKSLSVMAASTTYLFMPGRALAYGLTKSEASWVVSISGITSAIGRLMFGFITDFRILRQRRCYIFAAVMTMSSALCALSFHHSKISQMIFSILFGISHGQYAFNLGTLAE